MKKITISLKKNNLDKFFKIMKISFFLLFACFFQVFATNNYAQTKKLTLSMDKATIAEVLQAVEDQSEFKFFYNNQLVDVTKNVDVEIRRKKIWDVLDHVLPDAGITYRVVGKQIALFQQAPGSEKPAIQQQPVTITGKVTDEDGNTLPGVNIVIKGTLTGAITNADGNYSIEVDDPNATLVFSFIGYRTQEVEISGRAVIDITFAGEAIGLEEVIAIGYGTVQKGDLTGSVIKVDLTTLEDSPNVSILQTMHGTVAGLNVGMATKAGSSPSVSIRGINTISGSNSPLIVLDGVIFRAGLNSIDPNSIESVRILKDASSAAIYGSESANGVILITSKMPKKFTKPIIEYRTNFSFQDFTNKDIRPNNREQYIKQVEHSKLMTSRLPPDYLEPNPNFDPTIHFADPKYIEGYLDGTDTDWYDLLTRDFPMIQNHSLSVRGKSELATYFLSFNYINQKNLIKNDSYSRYNIRFNIETDITDWLKIGTRSYINLDDVSGHDILFNFAGFSPPLAKAYHENGEIFLQPLKGDVINPLALLDIPQLQKFNNIMGNFYADIDIPFIEGLSYKARYSNNILSGRNFQFNPYQNNFTGYAYKNNETQDIMSFDNIITYKRDFGLHGINATFVYGVEKCEYESTSSAAQRFEEQTLGYNFLSAGQSDLNITNSFAWKESSLFSMGRLVYKFKDRYILTGTLRRDGFSGFGQNHKFGVFPSTAFAWRMNKESFMNNISWIGLLKLRLSYGANGNRTLSRYQTLGKLTTENPIGGSGGYLYGDGAPPEKTIALQTMGNEDLKWETTNSLNFGIDFSLLDNRLYGNIDYYNSQTKDLLYNISIPLINGVQTTVPANIGELENIGQEFILTGVPVRTSDFEWSIAFNFSRNRNKVSSILGIDADDDGKEDDLIADKIFIGKPLGVLYDYNILGIWQIEDYNEGRIPSGFTFGNYKFEDINEDDELKADDDRKILGYTAPSYRFGIQNIFYYKKNWSLKIFINAVQGGKDYYKQMQNPCIYQTGWTETNAFQYDYWLPENPDAKFVSINDRSRLFNVGPIESRSFIRLKEVALSYNLPTAWLNKIKFKKAKVFVSGTNLLTLTDWSGWDPETGQGLGWLSGYPVSRSYNFGFNVEF